MTALGSEQQLGHTVYGAVVKIRPSGRYWDCYSGTSPWKSSHCKSFEDRAPVYENLPINGIYGYPIFKRIVVFWFEDMSSDDLLMPNSATCPLTHLVTAKVTRSAANVCSTAIVLRSSSEKNLELWDLLPWHRPEHLEFQDSMYQKIFREISGCN